MRSSDGGKDKELKKPYRKPTVESRRLNLGVYGCYGSDDDNHGSGNSGHGNHGHRGHGNGHHGF
jgi:hypothetical protein